MTLPLFDCDPAQPQRQPVSLAPGAMLLPGFALDRASALLAAVHDVTRRAALRQMTTPGGHQMSAQMTNCGRLGWVTDRQGYRYTAADPLTGRRWPTMPTILSELATSAAAQAGYAGFSPDVCLINRYAPGARMGLHQDKDETDYAHPIVSVSLGLPVTFQFGGRRRADRPDKWRLAHGDVVVWGGPARLRYHGVLALKDGEHALTGRARINLTLRRAGP